MATVRKRIWGADKVAWMVDYRGHVANHILHPELGPSQARPAPAADHRRVPRPHSGAGVTVPTALARGLFDTSGAGCIASCLQIRGTWMAQGCTRNVHPLGECSRGDGVAEAQQIRASFPAMSRRLVPPLRRSLLSLDLAGLYAVAGVLTFG